MCVLCKEPCAADATSALVRNKFQEKNSINILNDGLWDFILPFQKKSIKKKHTPRQFIVEFV